jgi:hypothetical protein
MVEIQKLLPITWCSRFGSTLRQRIARMRWPALMLAAATLAAIAGGAKAFNVVPQPIGIVSSEKCLDVEGASTNARAEVIQFDCNNQANQRWTVVPVGNGMFEFVAKHSGMCLDVFGGSLDDGAHLIQFPCSHGTNQRFLVDHLEGNRTKIRAVHSNKCLDIEGGTIVDGARLIQFPCVNQTNQEFTLN